MKLSNDDIIHIVALPNLFEDQFSILTDLNEYDISTIKINTNLDQLNAKKEESFTNIPLWVSEKFYLSPNADFGQFGQESEFFLDLLKHEYTNDFEGENEYLRISKYSTETQLERLTTILDYLTKNFTPKTKFEELAEHIGMNKHDTIE